ncbi:hypothetical protein PMAYCL1PPCAC_31524, partial [Pristionchus mayeri]
HGTCVGITQAQGNGIELYYCDTCLIAHPNLRIIYKDPRKNETRETDLNGIPQRCSECLQCLSKPDCGTCVRCKAKNGRCLKVECMKATQCTPKVEKKQLSKTPLQEQKTEPKKEPKEEPIDEPIKEPKEEPLDELEEAEDDDETYSLPSSCRKAGGGGVVGSAKQAPAKGRRKQGKREKENGATRRGGNKNARGESSLADRLIVGSEAYYAHLEQQRRGYELRRGPMQCLGVNCTIEALPNSKYCSDKCGMSRAKERISAYLPKGVTNYWKIEPVGIRQNREDEIAKEQQRQELQKEKADLDTWHSLVTDYIGGLKPFMPIDREESRSDGDFMASCPVCTMEFGCKVIGRHIEKCFARSEKQTTYGASIKCVVNPDGIFCDQFNKSDKSYCRRLRVICPDHYKGDIEKDVEVCGYPKAWFTSTSTTLEQLFASVREIIDRGFCAVPRKDCKKHSGWMTLILGLIDNRRLSYYQKVDELMERRKAKPGDALLLMSNQTEHHQPLENILDKYDEGVKNGGE